MCRGRDAHAHRLHQAEGWAPRAAVVATPVLQLACLGAGNKVTPIDVSERAGKGTDRRVCRCRLGQSAWSCALCNCDAYLRGAISAADCSRLQALQLAGACRISVL